ncbi:MAG TPA: DUF4124 domain-containing protein [Lacipirellulaceae bacterium]
MRTALMVLALLAAPAVANQTVWKWVDEQGVTHYSDRPVQGAQRVEISVGSRADSARTAPSPARAPSPPAAAAESYRDLEIWKPADGDSIVNTGGTVEVRIRLDPALQRQHSVNLYFDGRLVENFPAGSLEHMLRDVPRGQHSLVAVILDGSGKRLQESPVVRFNVRQESVAQPPVGPALRPPPKPRGQTSNKPRTVQPSYAALNGQRPRIDPRTNAPPKQ